MAYTVTSLKALFQDKIAPGRDDEFLRLLQEAEIKLLETGRWAWCKARDTLTSVNGVITLDSEYAAILGAQVDGYATQIHVEDYEFYPDGVGEIEVEGGRLKLIDQGVNGSDQRQYKLVGAESDDTIMAILHKAPATLYDPDSPPDPLPAGATINVTCPDASAIKLCMLGIIYEEQNDLDRSRDFMATCYARLNDREKTRRGNAQATPQIRPLGRGIRRVRNFR